MNASIGSSNRQMTNEQVCIAFCAVLTTITGSAWQRPRAPLGLHKPLYLNVGGAIVKNEMICNEGLLSETVSEFVDGFFASKSGF